MTLCMTGYFIPRNQLTKVDFTLQVEVQYLHDFAGITMGASLTRSPVVNFSSVLGTSSYNIGTAISVDTLLGQLSQWDAGLSLNTRFLSAAVTL